MNIEKILDPKKLARAMVGGFFCFGVLIFAVCVIFTMAG